MNLFKSWKMKHGKEEKWFADCLKKYKKLDVSKRFEIEENDFLKVVNENTSTTAYDTHYEYHPAWAARVLAKTQPSKHIDISSKLAFSTLVSAFVPIEFYDYRPATLQLDNLVCKQADLTALPFENNSVSSLSCMHTVEHIGLGRYGDEIDPDGDLKAIRELQRVVAEQGNLLFVVPVGRCRRLHFNAHRIYTYDMITEYFDTFELVNFAFIRSIVGNDEYKPNASRKDSFTDDYGCGCFWFKKPIGPNKK